jgi:hypothetical protein
MQWCWIKRRFRLSAAPMGLPPSSEYALLSLGFDAAAQLAARRQHGCEVPAERTKESADELPSMLIWQRRHRIEGIMTSRLSKKEEKENGIRSSRGTRETPNKKQEREGHQTTGVMCRAVLLFLARVPVCYPAFLRKYIVLSLTTACLKKKKA